jgi:hypothetical protein
MAFIVRIGAVDWAMIVKDSLSSVYPPNLIPCARGS